MSDVSKIQINGELVNIKDTLARSMASKAINKKYLFVGDSYMLGTGATTEANKFINIVINTLELNAIVKASGGSGFVDTGSLGTFQTLLTTVAEDPNITDIVVLGGLNDSGSDISALSGAIQNFCTYAKNRFVNAKIHIGYLGKTMSSGVNLPTYAQTMYEYMNNCFAGYSYINNCENILTRASYLTSDKIHPNDDGHKQIASYLISYLLNGNIDVFDCALGLVLDTKAYYIGNSTLTFDITKHNGITTIKSNTLASIAINDKPSASFTGTLGSAISLGQSDHQSLIWGKETANNEPIVTIPVQGWLTYSGGAHKPFQGYIGFHIVGMRLYPQVIEDGAFNSGTIIAIGLLPFNASFPSYIC